ncbi:MAG TPA: tetratricopeptide repeat protein [Aestuariivirgaceae bacterium]
MTMHSKCVKSASHVRLMAGAALLLLTAVPLGGCQTTSSSDTIITGSTQPASLKMTAEAAKKWEADPSNVKHGLHYVGLLKSLGQSEKAMSVMGELVKRHPGNANLLSLFGKELAEAGKSDKAVEVLHQLAKSGSGDWKVHSALGSAYDQQGQFKQAREAYQTALKMKPGEVSVLNNLAMSHALEGNLVEAERLLKEANRTARGAEATRVRQNLALVVGLQGRFDEAKEIASKDLPPVQVEANMTYLRNMLAQPDPWQQLKPDAQAQKG